MTEKQHDIEDEEDDDNSNYKIVKKPLCHGYKIYLPDSVEHNSFSYQEFYETLETMTQNDKVLIYIASFGGSCHTGMRIAHSIRMCRAKVTMFAHGSCHSMGAILALCGDNLLMTPKSYLMFHNYSAGRYGKGAELTMSNERFNRYFKENLEHFCAPFLTREEVEDIISDRDVYIHESDKDLKKRIKRHFSVKR